METDKNKTPTGTLKLNELQAEPRNDKMSKFLFLSELIYVQQPSHSK